MERNYKTKDGRLRPGLKIVHIGEDVWKVGKVTKNGCKIYGPNNTEYQVPFESCHLLTKENDPDFEGDYSFVNRHGNKTNESAVKIYILTHILDNKDNWEFDLTKAENGNSYKVIYTNGTVKKNILCDEGFDNVEITTMYGTKRIIKPIGFRKK